MGENLQIPLVSDLTHKISLDYGVLLEDAGHSLRGTFIIDDKGTLRQITMNDPPVGRSVDETLRLVKAYQVSTIMWFPRMLLIHCYRSTLTSTTRFALLAGSLGRTPWGTLPSFSFFCIDSRTDRPQSQG